MQLEGVITNVTNFGAFVDVGVHQDGLVHLSELSNGFVSGPQERTECNNDRKPQEQKIGGLGVLLLQAGIKDSK